MKAEGTKLAKLILEKERREKAARKRRWIVGGSLVLAVCVGALGFYFSPTAVEEKTSGIISYNSTELSLQRVANLLDTNPDGIVVEDVAQIRADTIHSVGEYTLLVADFTVEKRYVPDNEAVETFDGDDPADVVEEIEPEKIDAEEEEKAKEFANALGPPTVTPTVSINREKEAQNPPAVKVSKPLTEVDIMPTFPGGEAALYQFLSKQIRYPRQAVRNKVEGTVYVRFVIELDGTVKEAEIMRGIGHGCDEEALRVVQGMPKWNPGELAGQKVPVYSSLAVNFKFL